MTAKEDLVRGAAERSVARKKLKVAKLKLMPHFADAVDPLEKIRGLCAIIAEEAGADKEILWAWSIKELTD